MAACISDTSDVNESGNIIESETEGASGVAIDSSDAAQGVPVVDAGKDSGDISVQYIGVPWNYVYNPSLGSLHDYCTASPDEYILAPAGNRANFRGPCAYHDMCLEQGQYPQGCHDWLLANMYGNCMEKYPVGNQYRQGCLNTAHAYWTAVTIWTYIPH
ncbi:MAG: hypothetical protein R3B48_21780 [Kofleriaceae bacterium]